MIGTRSSRTSPRPPGNWCDARRVIGAAAAFPSTTASAMVSVTCLNPVIVILLLRSAYYLNDTRSAQARDLVLALAEQSTQHFGGVLAQERRCETLFDPRTGKAHRARHHRKRTRRRVLQ